jgi:fructose-bisphosphate aldolase class I
LNQVDTGVVELPGTSSETSTTGLDSLAKRCALYYTMGARFAKWRAVFRIDQKNGCPSNLAIQDNVWGLARSAPTSCPVVCHNVNFPRGNF